MVSVHLFCSFEWSILSVYLYALWLLVVVGNWTSKYYVITLWSDSPPSLGFVLFDCWRLWSISSDTLLNYFYKIYIHCPVVTEVCFPFSGSTNVLTDMSLDERSQKEKQNEKTPPQMRKNRTLMSNQNRRIAAIHNNKDLFAFWAAFQFLFHIYFSITNLSVVTFSFFFHSDIRNIHSILFYTNLRLQVNYIY